MKLSIKGKVIDNKVIGGIVILALLIGAAVYKVYFTHESGIVATGTV